MGEIWGIILAAGESKRMGFPKMLLDFNGKTMIECVIENVKSSVIDDIMVVLGAENEKLAKLAEVSSVKHCYNDDYKTGMLSSVKCGIRNLPSGIEAFLVFQGDQPFIGSEVIDTMIGAYSRSGKGLIIPVYRNRRGHPLLISNKYRDAVEILSVEHGLRSLVYKYPEDVMEIDTDEPGILRDFDTYEDYKTVITQIH